MVPLTKRRHSTRRGGKRKAAIHLDLPTLTKGKDQKEPLHSPHHAYIEDGYYVYKGKKIKKV